MSCNQAFCFSWRWGLGSLSQNRNATMPEPLNDSSDASRQEWFATTHWSVVLAARRSDSTRGRAALEKLCQTYWYPLYAFVRRLGHRSHDAEDMVQGFFERCLEKDYFRAADETK